MSDKTSFKSYLAVFFNIIKQDNSLLILTIIYGSIASIFSLVLPLSIQYISSQIIANASIFPIITISVILVVFLSFYAIIKAFQIIAFSYFEKKFFMRNAYNIAYKFFNSENNVTSSEVIQSYTEISNSIKYIWNLIFTTSVLIQQVALGIIVTALYHISFLFFNIALIIIICLILRIFFLKSIVLYRRELDIRYAIGSALQNKRNKSYFLGLLKEYYQRKTSYFSIILTQNIIFLTLYVTTNCIFLLMSGFLTLKGYITVPQFVASEIIFSLVFATLGEFTKNLKNIYELLISTKKISEIFEDIFIPETNDIYSPKTPRFYNILWKISILFIAVMLVGLFLVPWYQTSFGNGKIIAYNQDDRIQDITALVSGRIVRWYANDGQVLKKGDKIAEISDNDPDLMMKLENELESVRVQYENSKLSTNTAKINYDRQYDLYKQGLTARKDFEKAKIEYQKLLAYENEIKAKLIQTDVKLARQKSQIITAPKDGFILHSKAKAASSYVYAGEVIATFVPEIHHPAIELFINPNDMPLIHIGRKARIQIEGWPALRISGWPSTALGTFGGVVKIVDSAISPNGKFRVIIMPDPQDSPWPDMKYIKQGTKVMAWINMNRVSIGYEIWRQMNGFPIKPDEPLFLNNEKK